MLRRHFRMIAATAGLALFSVQVPAQTPQDAPTGNAATADKILITYNALPETGNFEVIGPIYATKRWFGGAEAVTRSLGEQARALGANAVVDFKVWWAPAFPVPAAPHGKGIAVKVNDTALLKSLVDDASSWE